MKLVKEVRYGEKLIKRIYLGYDVIYDPHTFILKHAHVVSDEEVSAFMDELHPSDVGLIGTVPIDTILAGDVYDKPGIGGKPLIPIIFANVNGTLDDIVFASSKHQLQSSADIVANPYIYLLNDYALIGNIEILAMGLAHTGDVKEVVGQVSNISLAIADGKTSDTKQAVGIDSKVCFVVAECKSVKQLHITTHDNINIETIANGKTSDVQQVFGNDNRVCFVIAECNGVKALYATSYDSIDIDTIANGKTSDTLQAFGTDNKVCFVIANCTDEMQLYATSHDSITIATIGNGKTSDVKQAFGADNKPIFVVAEGKSTNIFDVMLYDKITIETIANGKTSEATQAFGIDDNICLVIAECNTVRQSDITSHDNIKIITLADGKTAGVEQAYATENKVCFVVATCNNVRQSDIALHDGIDIITVGSLNKNIDTDAIAKSTIDDVAIANIDNNQDLFVSSCENIKTQSIAHSINTYGNNEGLHATINVSSHLDADDVMQKDTNAYSDVQITSKSFIDASVYVDAYADAVPKTTIKSYVDKIHANDMSLSGTLESQSRAVFWSESHTKDDVLFIFQSYDAIYDDNTKTLEII